MNNKSERDRIMLIGALRATIGVGLFVAPKLTARIWMSDAHASPATRASLRSLGGREVAVGLGTLGALQNGTPVKPWLQAGVLCDATDAINGLFFMEGVSPLKRLMWIVAPTAAALYGAQLWSEVD